MHRTSSVIITLLLFAGPAAGQYAATGLIDLPLHDMSAFRPAASNWRIASDVYADRSTRLHLETRAGTGVLANLPSSAANDNLFSTWEHGDIELEMEVLMPAGSNSGIYLQGRYEVQLFDSWPVKHPRFSDMGGIYERWDDSRPDGFRGYNGVPPRVNASRAPGLWQHLRIRFRAPRFDTNGQKTANAVFERVELNGTLIQEGVEVTGPTRASAFEDERPFGPMMIQGDHGPVAFRNIRHKRFGSEAARLDNIRYRYYPGRFRALPDFSQRVPMQEGTAPAFRHDLPASIDTFAFAVDGTLYVPSSGRYLLVVELGWVDDDPHFTGDISGGASMMIGGAEVLLHEGLQRRAESMATLEAGSHPFSLRYFKHRGSRPPLVLIGIEGPDTAYRLLNEPGTFPQPSPPRPIFVDAELEPVVLRGMMWHGEEKRTHVASVADPAGVHYAMDLESGSLLYAWRGPFMDVTGMWHARGFHQLAVPRGSPASFTGEPGLALLAGAGSPWPEEAEPTFRFLGYEMDLSYRPVFMYRIGMVEIEDRLEPVHEGGGFRRSLKVSGDDGNLWHLVASAPGIEHLPGGGYRVNDFYVVPDHAAGWIVRSAGERHELLAPVATELSYTIIW